MKTIIFFIFLSILLESTMTTLPLTLVIILFATVSIRKPEIFGVAFISGLFLDIFTLGTVGLTAAYFTLLVFIVFLYQKKFEVETLAFVVISSFIGALGYLITHGTAQPHAQALVLAIVASVSFFVFKKRNRKAPKYV